MGWSNLSHTKKWAIICSVIGILLGVLWMTTPCSYISHPALDPQCSSFIGRAYSFIFSWATFPARYASYLFSLDGIWYWPIYLIAGEGSRFMSRKVPVILQLLGFAIFYGLIGAIIGKIITKVKSKKEVVPSTASTQPTPNQIQPSS